jgi:hypothetical protein
MNVFKSKKQLYLFRLLSDIPFIIPSSVTPKRVLPSEEFTKADISDAKLLSNFSLNSINCPSP